MPTEKSVNARPKSKVLDGECNEGLFHIVMSTMPLPNAAENEVHALMTQFVMRKVRSFARSPLVIAEWLVFKRYI